MIWILYTARYETFFIELQNYTLRIQLQVDVRGEKCSLAFQKSESAQLGKFQSSSSTRRTLVNSGKANFEGAGGTKFAFQNKPITRL